MTTEADTASHGHGAHCMMTRIARRRAGRPGRGAGKLADMDETRARSVPGITYYINYLKQVESTPP